MASISTLTDNFNDNSLDATKWIEDDSDGSYAETNQQLEITTALSVVYAAESIDTDIAGNPRYNLTGSQASLKLVDAGNQSLTSYAFEFKIFSTGFGYSMNFVVSGGDISVNVDDGSAQGTMTYNATTHRYLRIREASGICYWDYSADGISWTNMYSISNPFDITTCIVQFKVSTSSLELSTTTAKVDDFNIGPPVTFEATALSLTSDLGVPVENYDYKTSVSVLTLTSSLEEPAENYDYLIVVDSQDLISTLEEPNILAGYTMEVSALNLALSLESPAINYDYSIFVTAQELALDLSEITCSIGALIMANMLSMNLKVPTSSMQPSDPIRVGGCPFCGSLMYNERN